MDISDALDAEVGRVASGLDHGVGRKAGRSSGSLRCRFCEADVVACDSIKAIRPLPSDRLDDVTDFLLCYKQSILPLSSSEMRARPGLGMVGDSFLMIHHQDSCCVVKQQGEQEQVVCRRCGATVGIVHPYEDDEVRW